MSSVTQVETNNASDCRSRRNANDFIFGKLIGEGSFSLVYLAKDIHTSKSYAIKVCEKQQIIHEKKQEYVKREREALNILSGVPGFLNLYCTFQDASKLYFVMTYAKNGTLLQLLDKVKKLDATSIRLYSAEILQSIEQMHSNNIIHRDLKPENILLDENFHTMIADFGSSRIGDADVNCSSSSDEKEETETHRDETEYHRKHSKRKRGSFVGTAQYVSPEILKGKFSSRASDLWSFGCIMYQIIAGYPPFRGANDYLIFQKISKLELEFTENFNHSAKDLITKLLVLDPKRRLGADDNLPYTSIRNHDFFDGIDFSAIRETTPSFLDSSAYTITEKEDSSKEWFNFPDHVSPGLDDKHITRLMGLELGITGIPSSSKAIKCFANISEAERSCRLEQQKSDQWHAFSEGELILKHGFVNKRKGALYVPRRRMLLLTTGPRLIYVDPLQMVKKGEIPWSRELRAEAKNFKVFLIHTPHRIYYLEDPQGFALKWCEAIEEIYNQVFGK
ncbi:3-phosphoinositide-dependent protein kinase 1 isoform X2 [Malaya genurostris]|nr:3-phosphoinositide-dependent protein kinase 1 isoform X2 [Malaya genurostris]XP_058450237.1 3-phosphoinositide-dependent protein kinase 1 isoform X2 [Malaya genurostris]XP_058450238.1 3-phosphoinositide-dependent protein kinase 1 isoform X2 [Malaya genurostris]XP_058450239.1 3-phosphoinositide-dependent protein kinase 1 isoform X2 [Malaya genurostris]